MADARVAQAAALSSKFGPWLDKYRGGMSKGLASTIMLWESGGNFAAPGDASLGEVGFYQVASYFPPLVGLPSEARNDPETNIALGLMEYAYEAIRWYLAYPNLVRLNTDDVWKLSRLAFAIGRAGSYTLANSAIAAGYAQPGDLYNGILRYVSANGAPPLGSQSGDKVAQRVLDIQTQFYIAREVGGINSAPALPDDPPGYQWQIPANIRDNFAKPIPVIVWVLGAGALTLAYLWSKR